MKRFLIFCVAVGLFAVSPARAEGPDEQYIRIYGLIQQADDLLRSSLNREAYEKYQMAQQALKQFQTAFPKWNDSLVTYRLAYVTGKLGQIAPPARPFPEKPEGAAPAATKPLTSAEWENRVKTLTLEANQLAADKKLLEAKLHEALSAHPTTVDADELRKATERIKTLEKENDLLRVSVEQDKTRVGKPDSSAALAEARKSLAEAKRQLTEQTRTVAALSQEKKVLEARLAAPAGGKNGAKLRSENASLKQEVADLKNKLKAKPARPEPTPAGEKNGAKLQSENASLKQEVADLKNKLKAKPAPAPVPATNSSKNDAAEIKRLTRERDDLQKQLAKANADLNGRKTAKNSAKQAELNRQITSLQARLQALETRKVPYSTEELALFKTPAAPAPRSAGPLPPSTPEPAPAPSSAAAKPAPPAPAAAPAKKTLKDLPVGAGPLVAEAQRDFAAGRNVEADKLYLQVLRLDENNAYILGNLANIQLAQDHLSEAETTLTKALALDANDAYNLTLMGVLRFKQGKTDAAFEVLSRAAQTDPQNAETQNYLGITLSEKGQREAAEAALRKAIQLSPGYGSAHHNLAVVYATQNPSFLELARYHYKKALAAGHARNPELEKALAETPPAASK